MSDITTPMGVSVCPQCSLPKLTGVYGYAGPQCQCWHPTPSPTLDVAGTLHQQSEEIRRLRAELAACRHELEGAKKAANAQARLIDSLEQQRAHLNAQRDQWIEARDTLDSERAANAVPTEELAASREREARMRALIAEISAEAHDYEKRSGKKVNGGWLQRADTELAEGAQG